MTERAYAKVNLTLDISGRREDGYHLLSTVMQEVSVFDTVTLTAKKTSSETGSVLLRLGKVRNVPTDDHNLCVKAAKAFLDRFGIRDTDIDILLGKRIPLSAGLGGGSSDAAAVLRLMNRELQVNASDEDLEKLGATIGADVPFFIRGGTQLAEGIGDILTPLSFDRKEIYVLARPDAEVHTPSAYAAFDLLEEKPEPKTGAFLQALATGKNPYEHLGNSLMPVTANDVNEVGQFCEIFEKSDGFATMSGSGATVFGVFKTYSKARKALDAIRRTGLATFAEICLPLTTR